MDEHDIALRTLRLIEEIACDRSGYEQTEDEKAWSRVYQMAHHALAPECRANHPDFGRFVENAQDKEAGRG